MTEIPADIQRGGLATRLQYRVISRYATRTSQFNGPFDLGEAFAKAASRISMGDTSVTIEEIEA